ncbi:hypothetical protein PGH47_40090 [Streptomyces sp. HUAS 31]|uniref:hypothetical protein n=1 Tax=Streptomyces TaxID=1883 RepID=UPI0023064B61|nr:hypothetical protein [Streptomyces sp. HUAS 31]WCE01541.1 hypothetical protein PGH47_40090 [Streptomyces sp. HUAS 31]
MQADPVSGQVVAVNHTPRPISGATLTVHLYDLAGRRLGAEQRAGVDVAASSTAQAFTSGWTDERSDFHLLRLRLVDACGGLPAENTYWRYREAGDMRALNEAGRTRVSPEITDTDRSGDRHGLTLRLRNRGTTVAAMVRVSLLDAENGHRVPPTLYGDNHLWLLPGESRTLSLSWPAASLASGRPAVRVEGHNVPAVTMGRS